MSIMLEETDMEIKVRATQYDLDTKEATILADGKAFLNLDTLFYREKDHPESAQQISFRSGGEVILQRRGHGETRSEIHLRLNETGRSRVQTSCGEMEIDTYMSDCYHSEDLWMVEYQILADGQPVSTRRIVWELSGVKDDSAA